MRTEIVLLLVLLALVAWAGLVGLDAEPALEFSWLPGGMTAFVSPSPSPTP